ncbi:cellulose synthase-like protein G3 isoform X1 [Castanea sativa]|uniref:cellulose synthase-like protein G3 isoform X1 n=1 Tax=Castanea sativa TaxID=21020 RepID=UPI003F6511AF
MESLRDCTTSSSTTSTPAFHTLRQARRAALNRVFAAVYSCAILALLYHHALKLIHSTSLASFFMSLSLFISDIFLAFMWVTRQSFRMNQVYRSEFPEKLKEVVNESDFPALDVFICTADPYKEPPMSVVNTALSVIAYEYPAEKVSVYISDDGGSQMTLFALMEAAKFASHWLPFCRKNNLVDRSPDAYFASNHTSSSETEKIKIMYESMKIKVDNVLERGKVDDDYIIGEKERPAFTKWTNEFTRQDHSPVIQVLLDNSKDKDISGHLMPSLIYVSREKCRTSPHHFKAGALNALVRVSAIMTNAPIILTLDCDMYSNDPQTLIRVLCYLSDPKIRSTLGYIQFPQKFHGLNESDIYACEHKYLFIANPAGMDGLSGPNYVGTGCFFRRRALFGGPLTLIAPEIPELNPDHVVDKHIQSQPILELAHKVAGCNYGNSTSWGYKIGFKYGSLVEDFFTGYRLKGEGWKGLFCNPKRPAFLGGVPISLLDVLNQCKRWAVGLLEVVFSKYNPMIFGTRNIGLLMGLAYAHYSFWPSWSIPTTIYAFIPQLALLNGVSIFPRVSEPWFFLYVFLFLGAYGQHLLEFVLVGGTIQRWWNDQRMWMIRGLSCFLFGSLEYLLKHLGISTTGFNLTNKVVDDEQSKRYEQGVFDFGVPSPMFVPLVMAAIINLAALVRGLTKAFMGRKLEELFVQVFIAGFVVVNSAPIYEAMVLRSDKGRMPIKTTSVSIFLALALYVLFSHTLRN